MTDNIDKRTLPHPRNEQRRNQVRAMKQENLTYAEIAEIMDVSRQRVQQLASFTPKEIEEILSSTSGICENCKQQVDRMHIHHLDYIEGAYKILCIACHHRAHKESRYQMKREIITAHKIASHQAQMERKERKKKEYTSIRVHRTDAERMKSILGSLPSDADRFAQLLNEKDGKL